MKQSQQRVSGLNRRANSSLFDAYKVNVDLVELIIRLARLGLTNKEIGEAVSEPAHPQYFERLLRENEEIREALEQARIRPNYLVEQALFKRAIGYRYHEITLENGKPVKTVLKETFPDVTAQIFWLKNRLPERWRDVKDIDINLRDRMSRAHAVQGQSHLLPEKTHEEGGDR